MKIVKCLGGLVATALLLAGCGGGNTLTGSPGGGGGTSGTATVTVAANPATIAADGSTTSAITATALDVNNAGVEGVAVTFGASAGGAIAVVSGTTDANGNAMATLSNLTAAAGTNITVTATAGGVQGTAMVGVVAIQQSLALTTNLPQIPSNSSKSATISALLRDASNNVLANVPVQFSASSGAITPGPDRGRGGSHLRRCPPNHRRQRNRAGPGRCRQRLHQPHHHGDRAKAVPRRRSPSRSTLPVPR